MTVKDFRAHFNKQLSDLYPLTEIDSFFFLLIEEYLSLQRIDLVTNPNFKIKADQITLLDSALKRLRNEEPIQHIMGKTEFFGFPFFVNKSVLIPRPETEELVEWVINSVNKNQRIKILDIGTGSGCISISLKKNLSNAEIFAIDISKEALETASKNASLNKVDIHFIEKNILNTESLDQQFDVIVSNPPYVRELEKEEIKNNVLENESHLALFVADNNPLLFYDTIADLANKHLVSSGKLFFEINQYLGKQTLQLLREKGFENIELRNDLFGNNRMIGVFL